MSTNIKENDRGMFYKKLHIYQCYSHNRDHRNRVDRNRYNYDFRNHFDKHLYSNTVMKDRLLLFVHISFLEKLTK